MLWEQGLKKAMDTGGPGSLTKDMLSHVHLQGGKLWVYEDEKWRKVSRAQVPVPMADRAMVLEEIRHDFKEWASWQFIPKLVDSRMPKKLGSHDVLGFFADGGSALGPAGWVTYEKTFLGTEDFVQKLDDKQGVAVVRFKKCQHGGFQHHWAALRVD